MAKRSNWAALSDLDRAALTAYARRNGRYWKAELRHDWMRARYESVAAEHWAALQGLRNRSDFGSIGLDRLRLPT